MQRNSLSISVVNNHTTHTNPSTQPISSSLKSLSLCICIYKQISFLHREKLLGPTSRGNIDLVNGR